MYTSLKDFLEFVLLWAKKRTGVHLGDLVVYPAMVRHCLCCHGDGGYAHDTNALCKKCCVERECLMCKQAYTPSEDSVGVFCAGCWGDIEQTWTSLHEEDPIRAESQVRSMVIKAHPSLMGCQHTK